MAGGIESGKGGAKLDLDELDSVVGGVGPSSPAANYNKTQLDDGTAAHQLADAIAASGAAHIDGKTAVNRIDQSIGALTDGDKGQVDRDIVIASALEQLEGRSTQTSALKNALAENLSKDDGTIAAHIVSLFSGNSINSQQVGAFLFESSKTDMDSLSKSFGTAIREYKISFDQVATLLAEAEKGDSSHFTAASAVTLMESIAVKAGMPKECGPIALFSHADAATQNAAAGEIVAAFKISATGYTSVLASAVASNSLSLDQVGAALASAHALKGEDSLSAHGVVDALVSIATHSGQAAEKGWLCALDHGDAQVKAEVQTAVLADINSHPAGSGQWMAAEIAANKLSQAQVESWLSSGIKSGKFSLDAAVSLLASEIDHSNGAVTPAAALQSMNAIQSAAGLNAGDALAAIINHGEGRLFQAAVDAGYQAGTLTSTLATIVAAGKITMDRACLAIRDLAEEVSSPITAATALSLVEAVATTAGHGKSEAALSFLGLCARGSSLETAAAAELATVLKGSPAEFAADINGPLQSKTAHALAVCMRTGALTGADVAGLINAAAGSLTSGTVVSLATALCSEISGGVVTIKPVVTAIMGIPSLPAATVDGVLRTAMSAAGMPPSAAAIFETLSANSDLQSIGQSALAKIRTTEQVAGIASLFHEGEIDAAQAVSLLTTPNMLQAVNTSSIPAADKVALLVEVLKSEAASASWGIAMSSLSTACASAIKGGSLTLGQAISEMLAIPHDGVGGHLASSDFRTMVEGIADSAGLSTGVGAMALYLHGDADLKTLAAADIAAAVTANATTFGNSMLRAMAADGTAAADVVNALLAIRTSLGNSVLSAASIAAAATVVDSAHGPEAGLFHLWAIGDSGIKAAAKEQFYTLVKADPHQAGAWLAEAVARAGVDQSAVTDWLESGRKSGKISRDVLIQALAGEADSPNSPQTAADLYAALATVEGSANATELLHAVIQNTKGPLLGAAMSYAYDHDMLPAAIESVAMPDAMKALVALAKAKGESAFSQTACDLAVTFANDVGQAAGVTTMLLAAYSERGSVLHWSAMASFNAYRFDMSTPGDFIIEAQDIVISLANTWPREVGGVYAELVASGILDVATLVNSCPVGASGAVAFANAIGLAAKDGIISLDTAMDIVLGLGPHTAGNDLASGLPDQTVNMVRAAVAAFGAPPEVAPIEMLLRGDSGMKQEGANELAHLTPSAVAASMAWMIQANGNSIRQAADVLGQVCTLCPGVVDDAWVQSVISSMVELAGAEKGPWNVAMEFIESEGSAMVRGGAVAAIASLLHGSPSFEDDLHKAIAENHMTVDDLKMGLTTCLTTKGISMADVGEILAEQANRGTLSVANALSFAKDIAAADGLSNSIALISLAGHGSANYSAQTVHSAAVTALQSAYGTDTSFWKEVSASLEDHTLASGVTRAALQCLSTSTIVDHVLNTRTSVTDPDQRAVADQLFFLDVVHTAVANHGNPLDALVSLGASTPGLNQEIVRLVNHRPVDWALTDGPMAGLEARLLDLCQGAPTDQVNAIRTIVQERLQAGTITQGILNDYNSQAYSAVYQQTAVNDQWHADYNVSTALQAAEALIADLNAKFAQRAGGGATLIGDKVYADLYSLFELRSSGGGADAAQHPHDHDEALALAVRHSSEIARGIGASIALDGQGGKPLNTQNVMHLIESIADYRNQSGTIMSDRDEFAKAGGGHYLDWGHRYQDPHDVINSVDQLFDLVSQGLFEAQNGAQQLQQIVNTYLTTGSTSGATALLHGTVLEKAADWLVQNVGNISQMLSGKTFDMLADLAKATDSGTALLVYREVSELNLLGAMRSATHADTMKHVMQVLDPTGVLEKAERYGAGHYDPDELKATVARMKLWDFNTDRYLSTDQLQRMTDTATTLAADSMSFLNSDFHAMRAVFDLKLTELSTFGKVSNVGSIIGMGIAGATVLADVFGASNSSGPMHDVATILGGALSIGGMITDTLAVFSVAAMEVPGLNGVVLAANIVANGVGYMAKMLHDANSDADVWAAVTLGIPAGFILGIGQTAAAIWNAFDDLINGSEEDRQKAHISPYFKAGA
ncbi:MAG: hypothetical protein ACM31L_11230 [Actinomycetota bacterium]